MRLFYYPILALLLSTACTPEDPDENDLPPTHFENSHLEVWVRIQTETGLINVSGASVRLYKDIRYREEGFNVSVSAETAADGKVTFNALTDPAYFISVRNPVDGEVQLFNEDTPYPTPGHPIVLNKLEVIF